MGSFIRKRMEKFLKYFAGQTSYRKSIDHVILSPDMTHFEILTHIVNPYTARS